ncbi:MAG TPA: CRISPR-associated endonuclease Cas2 [Spirochaetales bacterium]|nr:CRISPR-associated endonuclease Cas2 [Spirochaetales bacterium]HOV38146.1 CRISPR-associated endonuclease Cas2 [Spirochaetales bacterium]
MICYDITDPKRLRKTAQILENSGLRVQKSFFQCDIDEKKKDLLVKQVVKVLNLKKDYFYIYPLCEDCSQKAIQEGTGNLIRLEAFEIL